MEQQKKKFPKWLVAILAIIILLAAGAGIFCYLFRAEQKTDELAVELGQEIPTDIHEYLIGQDWALQYSVPDFSQVKKAEVGQYPVTVTHGWQEFSYMITVQDTTCPELEIRDRDFYLLKGASVSVEEFVERVYDVSQDVELSLDGDIGEGAAENQVQYETCGEHTFSVVATDASGNSTVETVSVIVDIPPVFEGIREHYIATGSEVDYLEYVMALDDVDGDVTDKIILDLTGYDATTAGDYEIAYSVEDAYGLLAEATATVHVMEPVALQEYVNTRQISPADYNVVGLLNLYDMGYYADDDIDRTLAELEPALVRIYFDKGNGSYSFGSGYIVEINEENIVICSNKHVVSSASKYKMNVHFHNGTSAVGTVVGTHSFNDISFSTVPLDSLDAEFVETLKTVHINYGYWENVEQNEGLSLGIRCVDREGDIWLERKGKLLQKITNPPQVITSAKDWVVSEVSVTLRSGMSGSPVVDGYGNLIAMARAVSSGGNLSTQYWCVPLNQILDFYEETFDKRLEYY